jgi:uncharacterized protein
MPKIQLLIVQPTPFCNIDCTYCYLPDRRSKHVVATETLANLFSQVFASGWARDDLTVVWHAGEPMVLPVAFYAEAFRLVDRLKPADLHLTHSFQTNGTLINEAWCDFFVEQRVNLGVSVDGPKEFHDLNRRTRSGQGTFDRTIAGIRMLNRRQVPFHVISVLTTASMSAPEAMFEFYVGEGIERVCFNVEESEGSHASPSLSRADAGSAYRNFMEQFWRLSGTAPGKIGFIREIEQTLSAILRPTEGTFFNELVEPFAVTTMDWAGNISTFSPELLGLKNERYGDFILGNVNRETLIDLAGSRILQLMHADIGAGVALCRENCQYFSVCGGGEPVNKLTENGSFISTETAFCRLTRMRVTDLILDAIDRLDPRELAERKLAIQSAEAAQMLEAISLATM